MHTHKHQKLTRRFLTRGLVAGLLLSQTALSAYAQAAAATDEKKKDDDVVVLEAYKVRAGFSGSLAAAAEKKQAAVNITEVIAPEDLGKLPDVSIADSLTRLPGLAAQRTNGRSQQISVRGLAADFTVGTLGGREQVSTNLNRALEFDQYPAELFDGVTVYKTAAANLMSQGLAGTIDMQTYSPLSKGKRQVSMNAYYNWNQLGQLTPGVSSTGERFGLTYIDQVADGKVGIGLGVSYSKTPWAGQQFQAWGYPQDGAGNYVLGGTKSYVRNSILDRKSLMFVLEFKPNEHIHAKIDIFKSDFQEKQLLRGMEIPLWWSGAQAQSGATYTNGLATNQVFANVMPIVRNDVFVRDASPIAIGGNLKINEKSEWPIEIDAGYSKISREDENLETYAGISQRGTPFTQADRMTIKLVPGGIPTITPTLSYADGSILKLSDPQGWGPDSLPGGGMYGYLKFFKSKDELGQIKASTKHELPKVFKSIETGAFFSERYKREGEGPSGYINTPTGAVTLPLPAKVGTTDMSFLGLGSIYAFDPLAAYNGGTYGFTANNDTGIVANRYDVDEKVTQAYVQLNIETKWGNVPIDGNIGLRGIHTDQKSKGFSASGNLLNPVSAGATYNQAAPNLALNFHLRESTVLRFSAARQYARPRMYDMRASRTWSYDPSFAASTTTSPWGGGGGNPNLKPWAANSLDLSLEHYFADNKGYFAIAGFTKKLTNYIYEQQSVASFVGYPVRTGPEPVLRQGIVSQPVNGQGGSIKGVEVTLSLASELINKDIKGFGIWASGAYTDSAIKPFGPTGPDMPIAGWSRKVAQLTFYYERHGFSARISEKYRSANRQYITTFGPPNRGGDVSPNGGFSVAQPEKTIDAQVSYTFEKGPLKNLTLLAQAYNLNNEPLVTYNNDDPRQVINYQKYGASYSVGASYKF
ncbi:MAG: TonB-dependent receptor [Opitutae bacterium]|nr:TonB-dependent receptor [Opitutae bacterium]